MPAAAWSQRPRDPRRRGRAHGWRALAGLVVLALAATAATALAAPPVEVRVERGLGGVVAAGGIDVAVVELRSAADVALTGTVELAGRSHRLELAARGVATVTVAARLQAGASAVSALPVRVVVAGGVSGGGGEVEAEVPGARVVARPTVVISDAPAPLLAALEPWRVASELGEVVVIAPGRVPAAWPVLVGAGALVLDRPAGELSEGAARAARRFLAAGGKVCRLVGEGGAPTCVQADLVSIPRTAVRARLAPTMTTWAWAALALTAGLAAVLLVPRRRGAVVVLALGLGGLAPVVAAVRGSDSRLAVRGVRVSAGAGEDWIAGEVGASDLTGALDLGPGLWIEPTSAEGGRPLDDVGLRGRVPGPGSWRLRGFVPAEAGGWAARLTRDPRPLPELP